MEHVSLLLNYSSCEQSTAESKGQAPSHELLVLIYKAEQSSEVLASVTEVFALDSHQTALGSCTYHPGQRWGPCFQSYVSRPPTFQACSCGTAQITGAQVYLHPGASSLGGLSNSPSPAEPPFSPLSTCLLTAVTRSRSDGGGATGAWSAGRLCTRLRQSSACRAGRDIRLQRHEDDLSLRKGAKACQQGAWAG